jgi:hypothetical protein
MVAAVLVSGMNIAVAAGGRNAAVQAAYGVGLTGLVLSCAIIHLGQAHRAGWLGVTAYWVSVGSLAYANVSGFLILAELAGIPEAHQALTGTWDTLPIARIAVYGSFLGLVLLGLAVARAGALPRLAGGLVALGVALQVPAQFAKEMAGPLYFLFTICGSGLFGVGLTWIGWALWSGRGWVAPERQPADLDRVWGGPLVIVTGALLAVDALTNIVGGLSLLSSLIHLAAHTTLLFSVVVLHSAQAERAGAAGLAGTLLLHVGTTLYVISALLIMAQLAGAIDTNRALMASWEDIPVGRVGSYGTLLGWLLFGLGTVRARVFPRWSGWLVVLGLALLLPFEFTIQAYFFGVFWIIGAILLGLGLAGMGWALVARRVISAVAPLVS